MNFHPDHTVPTEGEVFVFGSNLASRHGKGAALIARQRFGAQFGISFGYACAPSGPPRHSFAIPTKDERLRTLPVDVIQTYVEQFHLHVLSPEYAHLRYFVTRIGCGLAGYRDSQIAPLFRGFPDSCIFPQEWAPFL